MAKVKVARTGEIAQGSMVGVEVQGKRVLIANIGGRLFAMDGTCSHMGGHLWEGKLTDGRVRCPRHGSEFDLATGRNVKRPWVPLGKAPDLKAYQVTVEGEDVYLDI